jgi:DNA-binding CsgD family transcriptional regulator
MISFMVTVLGPVGIVLGRNHEDGRASILPEEDRRSAAAAWREAVVGSNELDDVAAVVESIGTPFLGPRLARYLRDVLPFDAMTAFVHRTGANPIHVFDDFADERAQRGVMTFLETTFVLNPFYRAHLGGLDTGIYRIADLADGGSLSRADGRRFPIRRSASEDSGYVTRGWPEGLTEIDVAVRLSDKETAEVALYRQSRHGGFSAGDVDEVRRHLGFIQAVMAAAWRIRRFPDALEARSDLPVTADGFAAGLITHRERQVLDLILAGCSSEAIGLRLGIALTTVKTHRKRAYAKLGISTQAQLFRLSLDRHRPRD